MLKEVSAATAISLADQGAKIRVLHEIDNLITWKTLEDVLRGCTFFVEEETLLSAKTDEAPPHEKKEDEPKKSRDGKRVRVDSGKIKALHDAGWSNVKIADEMHLHPVTVGKYLKEL